jgi:hypothetical protein
MVTHFTHILGVTLVTELVILVGNVIMGFIFIARVIIVATGCLVTGVSMVAKVNIKICFITNRWAQPEQKIWRSP